MNIVATRRLSPTGAVLLLMAAFFVVYAPFALWLKADYDKRQRPPPAGAIMQLSYFLPAEMIVTDDNRGKRFYTTVFRWGTTAGELPKDRAIAENMAVYENDVAIGGSPFLEYILSSKEYSFAFSTSDNSDPRENGRAYWIVRR
jgi:hypothetical protein